MFDRLVRLTIVVLLAAVLVAAAPRPVSAGPVGDAAAAVARWISDVEVWVQQLVASLWSMMTYSEAGGDDGVLRRVMIVDPSVIAETAERVGFSLHRFELPIGGEGNLTLWMRFEKALSKQERAMVDQALEGMVDPEDEARRQVLGLLLNAADWREIGESLGFSMTGVVIHANGSVRASLEYTSDAVSATPAAAIPVPMTEGADRSAPRRNDTGQNDTGQNDTGQRAVNGAVTGAVTSTEPAKGDATTSTANDPSPGQPTR